MPSPETLVALTDLMERRHTEAKTWRDEIMKRLDTVGQNCLKHDFRTEDITRRLNEGASHFAKLDEAIKPQSPWRYITWATPIVILLAGLVWQAARYPTMGDVESHVAKRSPYIEERAQIMRVVNSYTDEMPALRLKLGVIDYKLDSILKKLNEGD